MSITDVERGLVARYVARVFEREVLTLRATRALLYWLNDRSELLSLPLPRQLARAIGNIYSGGYNPAEFERAYRQNRNRVLAELRSAAEETPRPEPLASNVELLVNELGLPEAAWKVVGLIACYTRFEQVEYLCDTMSEAAGPMTRVISLLVGEESRNVDQLLSPSGDLITSGLVKVGEGDEIAGSAGRYAIPNQVNACLDRTFGDFADMRQALLGAQLASGIEISDYEHVAVDRDLISKVLDGAARKSAKGINILLYGPPGTGKTELTKVAAESVGVSLYGAGEEVHSEGEADRSARLQDLVFSLRLLSESDRTALLFDEMEDVAWQLIRRGGSKIYLNRLLEKNPVPILWTSNNIHEIDPALLRRMTLAVELRLPPPSQRQRILHRLADRVGVALSGEEIETLANRIEATPAILENALKAAQLSGGGAEAVERAALGVVRAVSGAAARRPPIMAEFDTRLVCASLDLVDLTEQIVKGGKLAFSLCLSGPPGTGKSAYARYLANRLGLEVLHKRASDLLGPFVGESEKRIADAFAEALEAGAFLVFDEADSLLFDRTQAVRSWEITQVNEMLTWMEEHPWPVCFTTNLMDRLDTASLRRFTFHVRFEYLDRTALEHAFEVFFAMTEVPAEGLKLTNMTPGDFAQARKQADVLGITKQPEKVVRLLDEISRGKPGAFGSIGFTT